MIRKKRNTIDALVNSSGKLIGVSQPAVYTDLLEDRVRWFYRDADDKRWYPFNGYDSINLETMYKAKRVNITTSISINSLPSSLDSSDESDVNSIPVVNDKSYVTPNSKVSVRSGLYDVDLRTRLCKPVYWAADKRPVRVIRGIWFKDYGNGVYEPLEDDELVGQLELEYLKCFAGGTIGVVGESRLESITESSLSSKIQEEPALIQTTASAPSLFEANASVTIENKGGNKRCVLTGPSASFDAKRRVAPRTIKFLDCHVEFCGSDEVYLYQDSTALYIRQKLGMPKVGTRLRRGYKEVARSDDRPPDVTHLCFVVHGIGQKIGSHSITRCVNDLRESCAKLQAKYFTAAEYANERVEFLPVEWRSSLQLDGDMVESITPAHVRGLRTTLNSSAMDIMYYTSPLYRTEIITSLLSELNRLYSLFCTRNPLFTTNGGKVSVIAHSLGCVLIYDLITGWNQPIYDHLAHQHHVSQSATWRRLTQSAAIGTDDPNNSSESCGTDETASTDIYQHGNVISPTAVNETDCCKTKGNSPENPQNLQQIARLGLLLDTAKLEVSWLERKLTTLLQLRNGTVAAASCAHSQFPSHANEASSADSYISSQITASSLLFKHNLQNLFCLGSPLPVFLVLRGVRPGADTTQDSILPRSLCPRIFNIYHPADPVAYRLEPLILKHYRAIQPAIIHRADASNKPDYDEMPLITISGKEVQRQPESISQESEPLEDSLHAANHCDESLKQSSDSITPSADINRSSLTKTSAGLTAVDAVPCTGLGNESTSKPHSDELLNHGGSNNSLMSSASPDEVLSFVEPFLANEFPDFSVRLEHRLDYQLRCSRYENLYLSILSSHTGYWSNVDIGMLILSHMLSKPS